MIYYKAKLQGINIITQEESYTSKASFFDNDYIPIYGIDDKTFKSSGKHEIISPADVGFVVNPVKVKFI